MIEITLSSTTDDLLQIKALQRANLRAQLDDATQASQGFVTIEYTLEELELLHHAHPSVIAKDGHTIAGFALVMVVDDNTMEHEHWPFLKQLQNVEYDGKPLKEYRYYIMGQVCIAAAYRGKGLFTEMYEGHHERLSTKYDLMVTDISTSNFRSLRAHEKMGFRIIHTYRDHLDEWHVVVWDWRSTPAMPTG